ncbi:MAG: hypothetical protein VXW65_07960 [Pseudomonadota bacterium]|nr:hypothetical protein [Pseudomonadota bacterium]
MTITLKPYHAFWLAVGLSIITHSTAQPVQKWQDAQGQWHFGDAAAAQHAKNPRPVTIQHPVSVIRNHHPLPRYTPTPAVHSATSRRTAQQHRHAQQKSLNCTQQREQLTQPSRSQAHARQRQSDYERNCVMGVYYGDPSHE